MQFLRPWSTKKHRIRVAFLDYDLLNGGREKASKWEVQRIEGWKFSDTDFFRMERIEKEPRAQLALDRGQEDTEMKTPQKSAINLNLWDKNDFLLQTASPTSIFH